MTEATSVAELSVVVTVVDGGATLVRCLDALSRQVDPPAMEILVPFDDSVAEVGTLAARYPGVRFVALGRLATEHPAANLAGQHELFDRRRSAGLATAASPLVAILEDRGAPRPGWARAMVDAHRRERAAAVGGAIENANPSLLAWAVYYCDFGRYQLPFASGPRPYVSDVNICYRRDALAAIGEVWKDRYHETSVNWALRRAGQALVLRTEPIVDQWRAGLRLGPLLGERIVWGRLYGYTRAREISLGRRLALAVLSPVTAVVLFLRLLGGRFDRNRLPLTFLRAIPAIALLLGTWCAGEAIGYLTKRA
jgi:hypothetical protein